jgi:hypothetical protein
MTNYQDSFDKLMGHPMQQLNSIIAKVKVMNIKGREVDEGTLEIDGVYRADYPEFCDAFFAAASFVDGTELTDLELEQLTSDYPEMLNEMAFESFL